MSSQTPRRPRMVTSISFVIASPTFFAARCHRPLAFHPKLSARPTRKCRVARFSCRVQKDWKVRSSSALNQENAEKRYIDLRTMKVIDSEEAHINPEPSTSTSFGVLCNRQIINDPRKAVQLQELLFTDDTIPLSDSQQQAVQALLSSRSVLYMSAAGDEKYSMLADIVLRTRLWKKLIVYCSSSRRSAEAMYATLYAQLGPERRSEITVDFGDGGLEPLNFETTTARDGVRVIFTSPDALKANLVACESDGWISNASIVFMDSICVSSLPEWEEILLAMPSSVLLCLFTKELPVSERELLPLWLETIQNTFVSISPPGAASLLDRIERPQNIPLLRTFAYNAAIHDSPVQVSLTLLRDLLEREMEQSDDGYIPKFGDCFLQGITMIPAEDPAQLEFANIREAEYADVCSLILADAKRTQGKVRARVRKRSKTGKRKERTASSRAAARRRREAAFGDSCLLPAIVMVRGHGKAESAAFALQGTLGKDISLLWDDDSKEHLEDIIAAFKERQGTDLPQVDRAILHALGSGIGIVHDFCSPSIRLFVEELFRGGLLAVIVADTYLGSTELLALSCAKSVLAESSALAICDDDSKGLIMASTAASLAGRKSKDDVGNLIFLWYDESVDDEAAGSEIASTLLYPLFSEFSHVGVERRRKKKESITSRICAEMSSSSQMPLGTSHQPSLLSSSYNGILRSLRRFGVDGHECVLDYTLRSYRGWLERASLHATLEKLDLEKASMNGVLEKEDWSIISDFERRVATLNEEDRVFKAMQVRYNSVVSKRLQEELQLARPGRIIEVQSSRGRPETYPFKQKLLEGTDSRLDDNHSLSEESNFYAKSSAERSSTDPGSGGVDVLKRSMQPKRDGLSTAVFVALLDQESEGIRIKDLDCRWVVVCILADGMWTTVPMVDVVSFASEDEELVQNVDLLMIPHSATFDVDPTYNWAKCCPVDDAEKAAVHRISDELIARVVSTSRPLLERFRIPEYEVQNERVQKAHRLHRQSPWYGRNEELVELRRLRRRAAELGDEIIALRKKQARLEEKLFERHSEETSNQSSILAVLEDCHALTILSDQTMEMTPIGALGSILPGQYPLFAAACLSLIDGFESLSPPDFATFIAVVACSGRIWTAPLTGQRPDEMAQNERNNPFEQEIDFIIARKDGNDGDSRSVGRSSSDERAPSQGDSLESLLPRQIAMTVNDILIALQQLHRRHQDERKGMAGSRVSDVVPALFNVRLARAVGMFASENSWNDVLRTVRQEGGYLVRELRNIMGVLRVIATNETDGEFSDTVRDLARKTHAALNRWPVRDSDTVVALVESGVVEKMWNGNTYEKWWRSARGRISALDSVDEILQNEKVESVEAEILES